jgi:hypothetical protein
MIIIPKLRLSRLTDSASTGSIGQLIEAQANLITDTTAAAAILSTLNPDNSMEENERLVLEIYLATIARGIEEFTQEQYELLYGIATQHPLTGGEAVYLARGMIDLFVDDSEAEGNQRKGQFIDLTKNLRKKGKLFPNPANTEGYYIIKLDESDFGNFQLYDITGIPMFSAALKSGSNTVTIPVIQLSGGVYFYRVKSQTGILDSGKWIIIK